MATGTVKWFNNAKGYGFVVPCTGGADVFAHYSCIQMDGYRTLRAGQSIVFDIEDGPKGLHAVRIRPLDKDESLAEAMAGDAEAAGEVEVAGEAGAASEAEESPDEAEAPGAAAAGESQAPETPPQRCHAA